MWTLAPSLVASTQKGWGELVSLATGERWDVRPEDLPIVQALAVGIPETEAEQYRELPAVVKLGWAVQAVGTSDEYVRKRLVALERHFAWCRAAMAEAAHNAVLAAHAARRHLHGFVQRVALPETVARRAALLALEPRDVIVLGHDDFLSLGLLALGHRVTVLHTDAALAHLARRATNTDAPLTLISHDLREPLPAHLVGAFDAFYADPLSSPGALRLCLARGAACLRPSGRGFICVSEAGAQSFATLTCELGVDVTDHYSDFNHYYGPDYNLAFYTSDLLLVRSRDNAALRPRPEEPYLVRGLTAEDDFLTTPASRYAFKNINPATCQLIHLDTAMQLLERAGRLQIRQRSLYEDGGVRSYLVHTKHGSAVFVRLVPEAKMGELFVAPAESDLEDALVTVLLGTFGIAGTVVQKHRVRGSSVYTMT